MDTGSNHNTHQSLWTLLQGPERYKRAFCCVLCVLTICAGWRRYHRHDVLLLRQQSSASVGSPLADKINPNTASWSSLARLPGIGPARASRIVKYRSEQRSLLGEEKAVFTQGRDLVGVKSIGPITIARIARYLTFEEPSHREAVTFEQTGADRSGGRD